MLELENIQRARKKISSFIPKTPLVYSQYLSKQSRAEVYLKLESLQPTRSFKVRGALNKLLNLDQQDQNRPLVAASAGNHGLGIAYAADILGFTNLTVFVPTNCPKPKLEKFDFYSANLQIVGDNFDEAVMEAKRYLAKCDGIWISAYNDLDIISGQATLALEILEDLPQISHIIVPVGGGGLIAGIAFVCSVLSSGTLITGIQPVASPSALLSFQRGYAIDPFDHEPTIADGLAGGFGELPFRVVINLTNKILLASEDEIRESVFALIANEQIITEPSGAISIVPLLEGMLNFEGQKVVCVISGGNLSLELLTEIVNRDGRNQSSKARI